MVLQKKLGQILVDLGVITTAAVNEVLDYIKTDKSIRFGDALISLGLADEVDVAKGLAEQFNLEYTDLRKIKFSSKDDIVSIDFMKKFNFIVIEYDKFSATLAISDPLSLDTLDLISITFKEKGRKVIFQVASHSKILGSLEAIEKSCDINKVTWAEEDIIEAKEVGEEYTEQSAAIVRLSEMIITQAVNCGASDIHVEPMSNRVQLRYRIDGICISQSPLPISMEKPLINRFKLMAKIDLAQKRLPQDGRINFHLKDEKVIDLRVSTIPAYYGESVVMRILDPASAQKDIGKLGFFEEDRKRFENIIKSPNGVFIVAGPTGSGKTTTLYSAINTLNTIHRKIITAEDPVEYNFVGINQVQVNPTIGLTFATILRSMLRQAPNIILVGEIRDVEVADIAIQAALTGHLVFSTLHTNDAPSAITRLTDMGVKPFLIASSIQAVMSQRLVRVICNDCREECEPDSRLMKLIGFSRDEILGHKFYKGRGCPICRGTGYKGRIGIFELMEMTNELRELAFNRAPLKDVRKAAIYANMTPIVVDGRRKIMSGITTVEEVARVSQVSLADIVD